MNDAPLIKIEDGRYSSGYDVVTSANGFQGSVVASGMTLDEACAIAQAFLPALMRKALASFDSETNHSAREIADGDRDPAEYLRHRDELRMALIERCRIDGPDDESTL